MTFEILENMYFLGSRRVQRKESNIEIESGWSATNRETWLKSYIRKYEIATHRKLKEKGDKSKFAKNVPQTYREKKWKRLMRGTLFFKSVFSRKWSAPVQNNYYTPICANMRRRENLNGPRIKYRRYHPSSSSSSNALSVYITYISLYWQAHISPSNISYRRRAGIAHVQIYAILSRNWKTASPTCENDKPLLQI